MCRQACPPSLPSFPTVWTVGTVVGAEAGEVSAVSGGQVRGAAVMEHQPDPVLSINLNPYPRARAASSLSSLFCNCSKNDSSVKSTFV